MMMEKSLPQPSSPHLTPERRLSKYSIIWAGAAVASLLYLILLATQPATVAEALSAGPAKIETSSTEKIIGETAAEVRALRDSVDHVKNELGEIRAQVSSQNEATSDLMMRTARLETAVEDQQKIAAADPATKTKEIAAAKKAKEAEAKEAAAKEAAAKEAQAKKLAAAKKAERRDIETGSVAQPATGGAIAFGPATVTHAETATANVGPQLGLQIATGPSVDSLRLSWTLLKERHGPGLSGLQPRYTTDMAGSEQTYDLVVGPVASADEARRLCHELSLKGTPCSLGRFTGDAL
jgi:uncharacterized protein YoxC